MFFLKFVLLEHKIISNHTQEGKRGLRVYPNWDTATNKQAQKTQAWQSNYFITLSQHEKTDHKRAKEILFSDKKTY